RGHRGAAASRPPGLRRGRARDHAPVRGRGPPGRTRRVMLFDQCGQDLRLAFARLRRARAFTCAAVLTLAVGIGASTAMFALIQGVLLRPLPVPEQDRLIVAWKALPTAGAAHWPFRAPEIDVIERESRILDSVAGIS